MYICQLYFGMGPLGLIVQLLTFPNSGHIIFELVIFAYEGNKMINM